jgi:diguanylate cyclase (GGDEF)-like protein/PAS domain S-box-containing protein
VDPPSASVLPSAIPVRILLVEDAKTDVELEIRELRRAGITLEYRVSDTEPAFRQNLAEFVPDVILSDFSMPEFDGMRALGIARELSPDTPFIFVSGTVGEEYAIRALRNGATDYVLKSNLIRLPSAVDRALKEARELVAKRKTDRALRESEAGLTRAQHVARLAHVITGPDGSFERWSDTLPRLVGLDPAQMPRSTRNWLESLHPEDRPAFRATAIEARAKGTRADVEYRLRRADGAWLHIRQVMEPLEGQSDEAGDRRWFNTIQDVTEQKQFDQELRRFRLAMDISGDSILLIDRASMRYVDVNQTFCDLVGHTRQELLGMTPMDLFSASQETLERDYDALIADNNSSAGRTEGLYRRSDGSLIPVETRRQALHTGEGWIIVGTARDITERKRADERIRRLNRVYAVLSGINSAIVHIRDREELFREACRIAVAAGEFALARVVEVDSAGRARIAATTESDPRQFQNIVDEYNGNPAHSPSILALALRSDQPLVSNDVANDARIPNRQTLTKDGNYALALLPIIVEKRVAGVFLLRAKDPGMFDEEELRLLLEMVSDMAFALEHISKEEKLNYLAMYDEVTGLANRTLFLERLNQYIQAASPTGNKIAVVVTDIERFRTINESLGRNAGDAVIKQLAERLTAEISKAEVARIGADQFVIVIQAIQGKSEVRRRIERIGTNCLGESFRVQGAELRISAKAGVALFPNDGTGAEVLLRNAEAALARAKELSERYAFYTSALTAQTGERLTLENRLRQALEKNEFVLYYQPKIELETRRICGAEALIRWQSPELGLVPPMKFIPLMEETGLILDVGTWALGKAVADHLHWTKLGLPAPRVAVNVSAIQLRRRDFVATIQEVLKRGTTPPGIDLEITESLVMEDIERNMRKLKDIRDLGLNIAIDDFGTGYSSLGYLAKLSVQVLKIDRSFIITMLKDPDTMTLVQTIISLAHSLRLKVVAEGVDEEDQAKMLRLLRCDEMQGYLFCKPLPFAQMTEMLRGRAEAPPPA